MARIQNRFLELLAVKRRRERRSWTYREIQAATGIAPSTLSKLAKQNNEMYDGETVARLCDFLRCTVGELLVLVEEEEESQEVAVAVA